MSAGDIVELSENYTTWPPRGPRVTFQRGTQFAFRHILAGAPGYARVEDSAGKTWQIPVKILEVARKAKVKS